MSQYDKEEYLVKGLAEQENQAFEYLCAHYKHAVCRVIQQFTTDEELAKDLTQEVFVNCWKNIAKYDPSKGRMFTWLHTLARNTAINNIHSKNFKNFRKTDSIENLVAIKGLNLQVEEAGIRDVGLRKLIAELPPERAIIVELIYFQGFTHVEAADYLSIPVGTVKTRLRAALLEIKKHIKP